MASALSSRVPGGAQTEFVEFAVQGPAADAQILRRLRAVVFVAAQRVRDELAFRVAQDRPAAGLIVQGAFASAADIARRRYPDLPLDRLLSVSFDSARSAAALPDVPKLIGHSPADETVPFQSGRILHAAAAPPKEFVLLAGGHNDSSWFTPGGAGNAELEAFLGRFGR